MFQAAIRAPPVNSFWEELFLDISHLLRLISKVHGGALPALRMSPEDPGRVLRLDAAAKLFDMVKISSGAAGLAGFPGAFSLAGLAGHDADALQIGQMSILPARFILCIACALNRQELAMQYIILFRLGASLPLHYGGYTLAHKLGLNCLLFLIFGA
jgi:hypothetical protein